MNDKIKKTYIKKLVIENELSTPEARADRLKRVRNLSNLSRKDICEMSGININTYKGWELARFGGLPVDGAYKIVNQVAKSGVICSTEWLLYGKKPMPSLIPDISSSVEADAKHHSTDLNIVQNEFSIFQSFFKNAILEEVTDDSLEPNFKKGDFLAGVMRFDEEIALTVGQICIVQTIDGKKLIRYVKKGTTQGLYSLICANPRSKNSDIAILDTELLYSALVSRHYMINK